jgi:hypothetical protein
MQAPIEELDEVIERLALNAEIGAVGELLLVERMTMQGDSIIETNRKGVRKNEQKDKGEKSARSLFPSSRR